MSDSTVLCCEVFDVGIATLREWYRMENDEAYKLVGRYLVMSLRGRMGDVSARPYAYFLSFPSLESAMVRVVSSYKIDLCLLKRGLFDFAYDYEVWHVVDDKEVVGCDCEYPCGLCLGQVRPCPYDEVRRERIWCFFHRNSAYVMSFPTAVSYRLANKAFRQASGCRGLAHCVPLRGWGYDQLDSVPLRDCEHVYYRNVGNPRLGDMRGFGVIR